MSVSRIARYRKRVSISTERGFDPLFVCGRLVIGRDCWGKGLGDARAHFTPAEIQVLTALAAQHGRPMGKEALLPHLVPAVDDVRLIDAIVFRLRRKLLQLSLPDLVRTVWGQGYTLDQSAAFLDSAPLMVFGQPIAEPARTASA